MKYIHDGYTIKSATDAERLCSEGEAPLAVRPTSVRVDAMSNATDHDDDSPELPTPISRVPARSPRCSPELARKLRAQGGPPRLELPKVHVGFRLAADVVEGIKATGKGYNARVERLPREWWSRGSCDGRPAGAGNRLLSMVSPNFPATLPAQRIRPLIAIFTFG